ncbi:nucleoside hydrolase [Streptomyces sp. WMMC897]|uniref:nucleoside hydrolase n=1 Tax=Streptomyces sp. WMMC897 TaxID=3014782 RepID=UPI0022B6F8F7|nr:nucleoside hydrolase [Streptomyces sp. WMMC897]MCZ7415708.1 nucleoside hydrolase [Streptomyces sp. WMMC897]
MSALIIDTDPGLDDAHALAMALTPSSKRPSVPVSAICTVAGNVGIDAVTGNARWLLGAFGDEASRPPVYRGAAGPLAGAVADAADVHGTDGLGDIPRWPVADIAEETLPAALALTDTARRRPGEITLVTLGPLTNIALALRLEPRLPRLLRRVVVMGGAVRGHGNLTLNAEFNIGADPVAADLVFANFPDVTLVTWEATINHPFAREEFDAFFRGESEAAVSLRRLVDNRYLTDPGYGRRSAYFRADPLAMAVALDPSVVTRVVHHRVYVGYGPGTLGHGLTAVDWRDTRSDRPAATIVEELDHDRLLELLRV